MTRQRPVTVVLICGCAAVLQAGCAAGRGDGRSLTDVLREVELRRMAAAEHRVSRPPAGGQAFGDRAPQPRLAMARASGSAGPAFEWLSAAQEQAVAASSTEGSDRPSYALDAREPAPLPSFRKTLARDLRDLPEALWKDTVDVYGDPGNLLLLGLGYGASLAVQQSGPDGTIEASFRTHDTFKSEWREAFGALGNPATHFGVAGAMYLAGQLSEDQKTYEVGGKLFRALTITGISTMLGKAATWDNAPNGEWGTLPSGHTSSTIALASVMHREYGLWAGAPLYALTGFVGYTRLEDGEHYLSDLIMGGMLGLVVGHTVAGDGEPLILFGGRIVPYADPVEGSSGVAWIKDLP